MAKIQARVPDDIQHTATAVIRSMGLTVSDVMRMLMTRIAHDRTLPLDWFQPNPETIQAFEEAEAGRLTPTTIDQILAGVERAQGKNGSDESACAASSNPARSDAT